MTDDINPAIISATAKAFENAQRHLRHLTAGRRPPAHALSHYTDQAGALGILSNGEVWATHPQYLNDDSEMEHGRLVWQDAFDYLIDDRQRLECLLFTSERADVKGQLEAFYPFIFGQYQYEVTRNIRQKVYVACFTERPDQLSQWRGYGDRQGPAYSISLPAAQIASLRPLPTRRREGVNPDAPANAEGTRVSLLKVSYVNRDYPFPPFVNALEAFCASLAPGVAAAKDEGTLKDLHNAAIAYLLVLIEHTSSAVKNAGFEEEDEWRLVVREHDDADPSRFRPTDMGLAPYKSLVPTNATWRGRQADAVTRTKLTPVLVTQGPHGAGELGLQAMRSLLKAHDYAIPETSVVQSATTYRQKR